MILRMYLLIVIGNSLYLFHYSCVLVLSTTMPRRLGHGFSRARMSSVAPIVARRLRFARSKSGRSSARAATVAVIRAAAPRYTNRRTGGLLGIERSFLDTAWNGVVISAGAASTGADCELQPSSGCTNSIAVPAQGNGASERAGNRYIVKSIHFSGIIQTTHIADHSDVVDHGGYFFALVQDTQTNASVINSEDVFINPSTIAGSPCLPYPLRNLGNAKRFKILDTCYRAPSGMYAFSDGVSTGSVSPMNMPPVKLSWTGSVPVNCKTVSGTAANVTSVTDNSFHILAYAQTTAFTPIFAGKCRVRFVG